MGELVLILVIVMVVFGSSKLPALGDGVGRAIRNFKKAVNSTNELEAHVPTLKIEADAQPAQKVTETR